MLPRCEGKQTQWAWLKKKKLHPSSATTRAARRTVQQVSEKFTKEAQKVLTAQLKRSLFLILVSNGGTVLRRAAAAAVSDS